MKSNSFQARENMRQQNLKMPIEPPAAAPPVEAGQGKGYALPAPKPKRKQCSLYLDVEMMETVKRVARQRGVTIGAVIEACVKIALDQLE